MLLADESESMILKYLYQGTMFALYDQQHLKTLCILTPYDHQTIEIKNLVTIPQARKQGYATTMINDLSKKYQDKYHYMIVGTGDSPLTRPFYETLGFSYDHRIPDFFIKHYDHLIYESGVLLKDMIYLKKSL